MDRDAFLRADELRQNGGANDLEPLLISLADGEALPPLAHEYNLSRLASVEACVRLVRDAVGDTFAAPPGLHRQQRHELRALHHRLVKWDCAKVREAVSLAHLAGSLAETGPLHVHDVCAGKGIVALYVGFIRQGLRLPVSGTSWELEPARLESHELIKQHYFPGTPVDFKTATIEAANLTGPGTGTVHVLAKHACGPLTDAVIHRGAEAGADQTAVMTCCHALLKGTEDFWPSALPFNDRRRLARAADPRKEHDHYRRDVLGLVSRRVIDALRAKKAGGRLEEALPFGRDCNRNNVVLTPA